MSASSRIIGGTSSFVNNSFIAVLEMGYRSWLQGTQAGDRQPDLSVPQCSSGDQSSELVHAGINLDLDLC